MTLYMHVTPWRKSYHKSLHFTKADIKILVTLIKQSS